MKYGRDINYLPEPPAEPPEPTRYCLVCGCTLHLHERKICGSCKEVERAEYWERYEKDRVD